MEQSDSEVNHPSHLYSRYQIAAWATLGGGLLFGTIIQSTYSTIGNIVLLTGVLIPYSLWRLEPTSDEFYTFHYWLMNENPFDFSNASQDEIHRVLTRQKQAHNNNRDTIASLMIIATALIAILISVTVWLFATGDQTNAVRGAKITAIFTAGFSVAFIVERIASQITAKKINVFEQKLEEKHAQNTSRQPIQKKT